MFNRMIKTGIASVALAASAVLIAAPASADVGAKKLRGGGDFVHSRFVNDWGQSRRQIRRLKRNAIDSCAYQVRADARYLGYQRTRVVDAKARQIGKRRFRVKTQVRLFDGYRVRYDTVSCVVRRGNVIRADGLQPIRFKRGGKFRGDRRFRQGRRGAAFH